MAKINGVEMKAIKTFVDHEGAQIAQANIYLNGKKLGLWSQDAWGGPDHYDGFEDVIIDRAKAFKDGCPKDAKYYDFLDDPDIFMSYLLELSEDEKRYKKYLKDGYITMFTVSDGCHLSMVGYRVNYTIEEIKQKYANTVKTMKSKMFKNMTPKEKIYTSINDFSVVVDKEHSVPSYININ